MHEYLVTIDGENFAVKSDSELTSEQAYAEALKNKNQEINEPDPNRIALQEIMDQQDINARRQMVEEDPLRSGFYSTVGNIPYIGEGADELFGRFGPDSIEKIRSLQQGVEESFPVPSGAATAAGIGTGIAAATRVPGLPTGPLGVTAAKSTALGAGFGALEGGISGYLGGEGGPFSESRLTGAKKGAGYGALFGGPLGAVGGIGQYLYQSGSLRSGAKSLAEDLGVSKTTAAILLQEIKTGANIDSMIASIRRAGEKGMIADADKTIAQLLDVSIQSGGTGAAIGREAVYSRAEQQAKSIGQTMDETVGEAPVGLQTATEAAAARTAGERSAKYTKAYGTPIDYADETGMAIESTLNRINSLEPAALQKAIIRANKQMEFDRTPNQQIMADIAEDGSVTFREMPNVQQLDMIKRQLNQMATENTFNGVKNFEGQMYDALAKELRDATEAAVPAYGSAVRSGAAKIQEQEVLEIGGRLLKEKTPIEEVLVATRNADQVQIDALRLGLRSEIESVLGSARSSISSGTVEGVASARKILSQMSSPNAQKKMQMVLSDQDYSTMMSKLTEVRAGLELMGDIAPGSGTAVRVRLMGTIDDMISGGPVQSFLRGNPAVTMRQVIQSLTGKTDEALIGQKDDIMAELASVLTRARGKDAEAALRYIDTAQKGQVLTQAQASFVANTARKAITIAGREFAPDTEQE